jgi:hypothetical protein
LTTGRLAQVQYLFSWAELCQIISHIAQGDDSESY